MDVRIVLQVGLTMDSIFHLKDKKKEIQNAASKAHAGLKSVETELERRKQVFETIDDIEKNIPTARRHKNKANINQ